MKTINKETNFVAEYKNTLNPYWTNTHRDQTFMKAWSEGNGFLCAQMNLNMLEFIATSLRKEDTIYHRELWYPVIITTTNRDTAPGTKVRVTDRYKIGAQGDHTIISIGGIRKEQDTVAYGIPDIVEGMGITAITNDPLKQDVVLLPGLDYKLDKGTVRINRTSDPLESDSWSPSVREVYQDGVKIKSTVMWVRDAYFSAGYVDRKLAYYITPNLGDERYTYDCKNAMIEYQLNGHTPDHLLNVAKKIFRNDNVHLYHTNNRHQLKEMFDNDLLSDISLLLLPEGITHSSVYLTDEKATVFLDAKNRKVFNVPGVDDFYWDKVYDNANSNLLDSLLVLGQRVNIRDWFIQYLLQDRFYVLVVPAGCTYDHNALKELRKNLPVDSFTLIIEKVEKQDILNIARFQEKLTVKDYNFLADAADIKIKENIKIKEIAIYERHL